MANLTAEKLRLGAATAPADNGADTVAMTSLEPTKHSHHGQDVLPAPSGSSLAPEPAVSYATAG